LQANGYPFQQGKKFSVTASAAIFLAAGEPALPMVAAYPHYMFRVAVITFSSHLFPPFFFKINAHLYVY
jgi:hypothetical protein